MFRLKNLLAASVLAATVTAALLGCGGGDSTTGSSTGTTSSTAGLQAGFTEPIKTSSLSKAEFLKQASEICNKGDEHLLELISVYMEEHEVHPHETEEEMIADGVEFVLVPKFQGEIDQIKLLGAPAGDEKQVEAILGAMQRAIYTLERRDEISLATGIDRAFKHAGELALNYGLIECAN